MKTVRLGKTNLQVSRVGIGGIPIQRPAEDEAIRTIRRALDLGINLIDTAHGYGASEERIGKAIAGRREQVVLATKGGWRDKAMVLLHIDTSLQRLNTPYVDLWQFHNVGNLEGYESLFRPEGPVEAAREALQAGKIRHLGITTHMLEVAQRAVTAGLFETVQFPFNFVNDDAADKLLPLAREHDVGFIAMKPFAGGQLRDARLAIKYVLQFDGAVPDPGVERIEEVEEIVGIVNRGDWELTAQEHEEIAQVRAELGTHFCQWCGYCMPCAQGVEIPDLMNMRGMWKLWPLEAFIPWMKEAAESAARCIECGECEEKCPYHLPIRERIPLGARFYESVVGSATG
jgi:predicted aldo/keto reductase-like oxidoreductase